MKPGLFLLAVVLLLGGCPACAQTPDAAPLRVLFVGNSLTYVNNLPGVLRALGASQPSPLHISTTTFVAPGGRIAERWADGIVADTLRHGHWDALVLQEQGGLLACMADAETRRARDCLDSRRAHQRFSQLAHARGVRVLLLATWATNAGAQERLDDATQDVARHDSAKVVPAGRVLRAYAARHGERAVFPDGIHPSAEATALMAVQLFRALTGTAPQPVDLRIDFGPLAENVGIRANMPLEQQLATVMPHVMLSAAALAPLLDATER